MAHHLTGTQPHRLTSQAFDAICPGAIFEWHPATGYLTVTRSIPGLPGAVDRVSADVQSHAQAIKCTAAYAQGYAHAKTDIGKLVIQKAQNKEPRAPKIMDSLGLVRERLVEVGATPQALALFDAAEPTLEGSATPPRDEIP